MWTRTLPAALALMTASTAAVPGMAQDTSEGTQLAARNASVAAHDDRTLADLDLSPTAPAGAAGATPETGSALHGSPAAPQTGSVTTDLSSAVTLEGIYRVVISQ